MSKEVNESCYLGMKRLVLGHKEFKESCYLGMKRLMKDVIEA